jgi:hypothetical protein
MDMVVASHADEMPGLTMREQMMFEGEMPLRNAATRATPSWE